jgi:hypothetical protein
MGDRPTALTKNRITKLTNKTRNGLNKTIGTAGRIQRLGRQRWQVFSSHYQSVEAIRCKPWLGKLYSFERQAKTKFNAYSFLDFFPIIIF